MRKFIQRALKKLPKMDRQQVGALLLDIASENERLETVLHSMMDGVLVSDTEHVLILYNKAAEPLLHVHVGEVYEKKIWTVIKDEEIAEFVKNTLLNLERVFDTEYTLDFSGVTRILSFSIMPLVREKKIQGNLIHIEDVTLKRSEEARLRRAESLASLTTLAAGVAHEIKNPLGSMSIHLQLIEKELKNGCGTENENIHQYLGVINEEVNRLNSIVVDFLFAVRPMNTKLEANNLNGAIRETLDFIQFELEELHIKIEEDLCENLCIIMMDEKLLKQALLNLIKNAEAAMPDGGTITVSSRRKQDHVLLEVKDTGAGISGENLSKIFEPYFTTKEFGSGLGLTVVFKIVREHMGEITVKSKPGEGTTFSMMFPIPQKEKKLLEWEGEENDIQSAGS